MHFKRKTTCFYHQNPSIIGATVNCPRHYVRHYSLFQPGRRCTYRRQSTREVRESVRQTVRVKKVMEKSQIICFVTLGIYAFAVIFVLCGIGGNGWVVGDEDDETLGLWKACGKNVCIDYPLEKLPSWHKAVIAMIILGLLAGVAAGATFLWVPITTVCHFVAGGFVMISIIIYGAKYEDLFGHNCHLGWSFALATVSATLFLLNGAINTYLALSSGCNMDRRCSCSGGRPKLHVLLEDP